MISVSHIGNLCWEHLAESPVIHCFFIYAGKSIIEIRDSFFSRETWMSQISLVWISYLFSICPGIALGLPSVGHAWNTSLRRLPGHLNHLVVNASVIEDFFKVLLLYPTVSWTKVAIFPWLHCFASWVTWSFARITFKSTKGFVTWNQTSTTPEFVIKRLPELHSPSFIGTCQVQANQAQ